MRGNEKETPEEALADVEAEASGMEKPWPVGETTREPDAERVKQAMRPVAERGLKSPVPENPMVGIKDRRSARPLVEVVWSGIGVGAIPGPRHNIRIGNIAYVR